MATKGRKRAAPKEDNTAPVTKKPRKGTKVPTVVVEDTETPQELPKTTPAKRRGRVASKKTPLKPKVGNDQPSPSSNITAGGKARATLGVRRGGRTVALTGPTGSEDVQPQTPTTQTVKSKIKKILLASKKEEERIIDDLQDDSDDEPVNSKGEHVQPTMEGETNYTRHPQLDMADEVDENDDGSNDNALDLTCTSTNMRQVVQDTSIFDDPSKDSEEWWREDPTRETTLCELWGEERGLYDVSSKSYVQEDRQTIMKRFATILQVPSHLIETRMASMRNLYQRMHRQCKSGSEPEGRTDRQKEVLRLLHFLRSHIKTSASLTSYRGVSPGKGVIKHGKGVLKSTPKATVKQPLVWEPEDNDSIPDDMSQILGSNITPMKAPSLTTSEIDEASDSEVIPNTKHYSRNDRLHTENGREASVRRSLRLTPSPTKTDNPRLIKSSKNKLSCHDSAPLADKLPTKKNPAVVKKTKVNSSDAGPSDVKIKKKPAGTTAAERKAQMLSTSKQKTPQLYDISIEQSWHEKQGPTYRRQAEMDKRKMEKEKQNELANLQMQRNETIRELALGVQNLSKPSTSSALDVTPEQLWADSLVPHLKRKDEEVKDEFMVHVLGLAMKAIRGRWP